MAEQETSVADELQILDTKIKQLKLEYEQYFMGARPREPQMGRSEVQKIIIRFSNTPFQNTSLRFRFNSLCSRFYAFRRQWDAVLRRIEEGTYERQIFRANMRDRERGLAPIGKDGKGGAKGSSKAGDSEDLYGTYIAAREKCGESVKGLSKEKLQGVIAKQRDSIQEKYGCKDVRFRVVVENGKTKLKATPVK